MTPNEPDHYSEEITELGKKLLSILPKTEQEASAIHQRHSEGAIALAKLGWFVSPDMAIAGAMVLFRALAQGRQKVVRRLIAQYVEKNAKETQKMLLLCFPHLKKPINRAFRLYRNKEYMGAVALFVILSDRIGREIFTHSPLSRRSLDYVREQIEATKHPGVNWMGGWFLAPITEILPINAKDNALDSYEDPLNRHVVSHGINFDWDKKTDVLKIISYLDYIAYFHWLPERLEQIGKKTPATLKEWQRNKKNQNLNS